MRLVVSFSTIPSRINRIQTMVDSILSQTRKPDRFCLCVPELCEREGLKYAVPDWLRSRVEIVEAKKDYGPATKLIPTLESEDNGDTIIVTVDDDVEYHPGALEELVFWSQKMPDNSLGYIGCMSDGSFLHSEDIEDGEPVAVSSCLGGYRGILYKRSFFRDAVFDDIETLSRRGVVLADDHFFAMQMRLSGVDSYVIPTECTSRNKYNFRFLHLGYGIYDADFTPRYKVDDCVRDIMAYEQRYR